jgi:hypothetical protein
MRIESEFWVWFTENAERIFNFAENQEEVFSDLHNELTKVHSDLTFEMGPISQGKRELVISASGIPGAFPAVSKLLNFAPSFSMFHFVPFRPRRDVSNGVSVGGLFLNPSQIGFHYRRQQSHLDIELYIKGYDCHDLMFTQAIFVLLDSALGEFDVEFRLGHIGMHNFSEIIQGTEPCLPFLELTHLVDAIKTGIH